MVSSWPPLSPHIQSWNRKQATNTSLFPAVRHSTQHGSALKHRDGTWTPPTFMDAAHSRHPLGLSLTYFPSGKAPGIWGLEFISSTAARQCSGSLVDRPNLELITSFCWCRVSKPGTIDTLGQKILCWGHCRMDVQQHPWSLHIRCQ